MVKVHAVRPAHSGFGMYEVVPDGAACYEADTAAEYVKYVLAASDEYEAVTPGHEGWPQVLDAEGKVQGQSGGTLLGWASPDGRVDLEVVWEVPRDEVAERELLEYAEERIEALDLGHDGPLGTDHVVAYAGDMPGTIYVSDGYAGGCVCRDREDVDRALQGYVDWINEGVE